MPGTDDTRQWFLKIAEETIFGPVFTRSLVLWAEQGRVLPGHMISENQETWMPAQDLPELAMEWYLQDTAGHLKGPLNKVAAESFIAAGKVPKDVRLIQAGDADLSRLHQAPGEFVHPAEEPKLTISEKEREQPDPEPEPVVEEEAAAESELESSEPDIEEDDLLALMQAEPSEESEPADTVVEEELFDVQDEVDAPYDPEIAEEPAAELPEEDNSGMVAELERLSAQRTALLEQNAILTERLSVLEAELATRGAMQTALQEKANALQEQLKASAAAGDENVVLQGTITNLEKELAELLALSNERDLTYQARIAALEAKQQKQTAGHAEGHSDEFLQAYELLQDEAKALQAALDEERARATAVRDASVQRQDKLQARLFALRRLLGDNSSELAKNALAKTGSANTVRLQAELNTFKANYQQEIQRYAERQAELERQVNQFKAEEIHLKAQVTESERATAKLAQLKDDLNDAERSLEQERKVRISDQEQFNAIQESLLRRIEELERTNPFIATEHRTEEVQNSSFRPSPWFKKKQ